MINLAGNNRASEIIYEELTNCEIPILVQPTMSRGEIVTNLKGSIGQFIFTRAWSYWCVTGPFAIERAKKLYDTPVGKRYIRAGGYAGGHAINGNVVSYVDLVTGKLAIEQYDEQLAQAILLKESCPEILRKFQTKYTPKLSDGNYEGFVTDYHVDTELGLYMLANEIKAQGDYPTFDVSNLLNS